MAGVFKAYDVRGVYPGEIDENLAFAIGYHFRAILDEADLACGGRVVVSHDMRPTSPKLAAALCDGLRTSGLSVIHIGLATTPMNYFAIGHLEASGGIQVTASHNPAKYNGFKLSRRQAIPVSSDSGIAVIEKLVHEKRVPESEPKADMEHVEIQAAYRQHVLSFVRSLEPRLKVAVDVANGMATIYRELLEELNIELFPLYFQLDGTFPNHEANPLKPENLRDLQAAVRDHGCALGVAFDGDADRAIFVDDEATPVGADLITAILAEEVLSGDPGAAIVYDVRSSWATREAIERAGGRAVKERVGHSFMKATMRELDSPFGGELAGHFYYRDNFFADSSLITVIKVLDVLRRRGSGLAEILKAYRRYFGTGEINFHVEDKAGMIARLREIFADGTQSTIDGITIEYDDWWFNVRPSNTEPLLRLVLEARSQELLESSRQRLLAVLGTPES